MKVGNYSTPWLLALANSKLLEAAEKHPQDTSSFRVFCRVFFFNHVGVDVPYGVDVNMLLDL